MEFNPTLLDRNAPDNANYDQRDDSTQSTGTSLNISVGVLVVTISLIVEIVPVSVIIYLHIKCRIVTSRVIVVWRSVIYIEGLGSYAIG
jgi:hypothetical protein